MSDLDFPEGAPISRDSFVMMVTRTAGQIGNLTVAMNELKGVVQQLVNTMPTLTNGHAEFQKHIVENEKETARMCARIDSSEHRISDLEALKTKAFGFSAGFSAAFGLLGVVVGYLFSRAFPK
jgi:hypothetical protein